MKFLGLIPQKFIGIDIGTSSIKVVELSSWAGRNKLENYGEISASVVYKKQFRTFKKSTLLLSNKDVSRAIKAIIEEAGIKSREVAFSIPDFSSFFTTFNLPPMSKEEIPHAVKTEARRHIPLPLGEVTIDWQTLDNLPGLEEKKVNILLVAVPNEIIHQYQRIATSLDLELSALEAEVFALKRALVEKDEKRAVALVDIGARSTSCSIINNRTLKISRSFDISGDNFTERIARGLSVEYDRAEKLKSKYGILSSPGEMVENNNVREILLPLIDLIINETERMLKGFHSQEKKEVKRIIVCGGNALLPGMLAYFQDYFKEVEVEVANPFSQIYFPPILENTLKEMGPSYAIAAGVALRGVR